jgi:hypothetical protein
MLKQCARGIVVALVVVLEAPAHAGAPPDVKCKDAKLTAAAQTAAAVVKAVAANLKKVNPQRMERSVSRARSSMERAFKRAETKGGCVTTDDAATIGADVDDFVAALVSDLCPEVSTSTTTSSTSITTTSTTSTTTTAPAATTTSTTSTTTAPEATSTTTSTTTTTTAVPETTTTTLPAGSLVLNEVDYDQVGADDREFVEIFNPGGLPVDLAGVAVVLVNGADGSEYARIDLSPAGTLPAGGYLVVGAPLVSVPPPAMKLELPGGGVMQNGPDGIALVDAAGAAVFDAFSYEGEITAAAIAGFPATVSLVEGQAFAGADSNSETRALGRNPNGIDTDDAALDWATTGTLSPGTANP